MSRMVVEQGKQNKTMHEVMKVKTVCQYKWCNLWINFDTSLAMSVIFRGKGRTSEVFQNIHTSR